LKLMKYINIDEHVDIILNAWNYLKNVVFMPTWIWLYVLLRWYISRYLSMLFIFIWFIMWNCGMTKIMLYNNGNKFNDIISIYLQ